MKKSYYYEEGNGKSSFCFYVHVPTRLYDLIEGEHFFFLPISRLCRKPWKGKSLEEYFFLERMSAPHPLHDWLGVICSDRFMKGPSSLFEEALKVQLTNFAVPCHLDELKRSGNPGQQIQTIPQTILFIMRIFDADRIPLFISRLKLL